MLSHTAQYALGTVLQLARLPEGERATAVDLAGRVGVPHNYLSKTLHQLARAGVVTGTRGKHGGFVLARPAHRITLAEVVAPFAGVGERSCLLGRPVCSDAGACAAHGRWKAVAEQVEWFFARTTLADLLAIPADRPGTDPIGATVKKSSAGAHDRLRRAR